MDLLLVDDNSEILDVLEMKFEENYTIYRAGSAKDALEILSNHQIYIIISDLGMPEMDGVEFCQKVKEKNLMSVVIALTGKSGLYELMTCLEAGFDDYILKPFKDEDIISSVDFARDKINRWTTYLKKKKS
jgi:two-component system, cell cycle response regulator